jgi:flagellar basal-body rod protein FlgB
MNDIGVVGSLTASLVAKALDAASLRHAALAQNIANATTAGYQPLQVNFEEQLAMARNDVLDRGNEAGARRAVESLHAEIGPAPAGDAVGGDKIKLDAEIAKMMQNAVYYQSLLAAMSKNGSIVRMAVREGRG